MKHRQLPRAAIVLSFVALGLAACGDVERVSPEDQVAIAEALAAYLPRLAEVYATANPSLLDGLATEKEIAELDKRIRDLAAEGREVRPSLRSFDVEQVTIWSHSNALVTTLEIWDLKVFATGTDHLLSAADEQRNRVRYQFKRRPEGWQVFHRAIETTFE